MRHGSIPGSRGRVRPVTLLGDPVLHAACEEVTDFGPELARLVEDMFATMYAARGVGLAANQIGTALRVAGTGWFARCLQHEHDHLEGGLYVDRLRGWRRHRVLRQAARAPWGR
ncbi:peptide deformylase [Streptomyces sp. NPDC088736]|uniref:peptide deformylase n=1 Tax=Streptomyces sp. NPDC088736 TaxID=3365881 RepID=UPI0037FD0EEA